MRINRNCVINAIENGGINLIDIRSKIQSLKITWLSKWLTSPIWTPVANEFLKMYSVDITSCIQMNMHNDVENISVVFHNFIKMF